MSSTPASPEQATHALLIEANADLRRCLAEALEAGGFVVHQAHDSVGGLSLAHESAASLFLLGQASDEVDAIELCALLEGIVAQRAGAILLLVRSDEAELVRRGYENGARDFLVVPAEAELASERALCALRAAGERAGLCAARAQLDLAQRTARMGVWEWEPDTRRLVGSPEATELLGFAREHGPLTLDELHERTMPEDRAALTSWFEQAARGKPVGPLEHRVRTLEGSPRKLSMDAQRSTAPAGARVYGVVRDSTERRGARLIGLGQTDGLTGLSTREQFIDELELALPITVQRGRHLAVLCLDLNQFKAISGALSHEAGELLLVQIARRLREGLRSYDLLAHGAGEGEDFRIARIRGDEFTVLLPDLRQAADAVKVGKRILEFLAEPFKLDQQELFITVSIGIASFPSDNKGADELLKCAETAAYCARQQGRNTVLYYSPVMNAKAFERLTLETGLRRALERNELVVHYQPRIDIASGRPIGLEALVRWRHPELGLVSPMQFIPLAEETGLIVPIGEWILEHSCEQAKRWQQAGIAPVRMAVNLSSVQFRQPDLFETVVGALQRTGLDARWLELELTESLLMQNPENAVLVLQRLANHGIHLSIDDFGTGYSSLSYLKRFPIHSLKIDQTFIRELTTNPDDAAIATSIILMGKSLKLRVVAEGVETRSQLSFLRVMQCHEAQGYLFSPPVPAAEAERLLRKAGPLLEDAA
jgi:diguanylate cyclase (GGDEF)-like protein